MVSARRKPPSSSGETQLSAGRGVGDGGWCPQHPAVCTLVTVPRQLLMPLAGESCGGDIERQLETALLQKLCEGPGLSEDSRLSSGLGERSPWQWGGVWRWRVGSGVSLMGLISQLVIFHSRLTSLSPGFLLPSPMGIAAVLPSEGSWQDCTRLCTSRGRYRVPISTWRHWDKR